MSQVDLQTLYSPSRWSKRYSAEDIVAKHLQFTGKGTEEVRETIPNALDISYGPGKRQKIDLYGTDLPDGSPVYIHIHGGYWQEKAISKDNSGFVAKVLYKHNVKTIIVGYDLCPDVSLPTITGEIEMAIKKCIEFAKTWNSRHIYIGGHSAGGHLVAFLFNNFYKGLPVNEQLIKGVFLYAGVYDLTPLLNTIHNDALKLNESQAVALSPLNIILTPSPDIKFYVIAGENESPAFIEQSKLMHHKLIEMESNSNLIVVPDTDHFDLVEKLMNQDYILTKLILDVIKGQ